MDRPVRKPAPEPAWYPASLFPFTARANGPDGPTDENFAKFLTEYKHYQYQLPCWLWCVLSSSQSNSRRRPALLMPIPRPPSHEPSRPSTGRETDVQQDIMLSEYRSDGLPANPNLVSYVLSLVNHRDVEQDVRFLMMMTITDRQTGRPWPAALLQGSFNNKM